MKIYTKNKKFIPEKISYRMQLRQMKREKDILLIIFIINLMLLPRTVKDINIINEKPVSKVEEIKSYPTYIDSNSISVGINDLFNDDIEEVHITNNSGDIIINNFDKLHELSLNSSIIIKDVNLNNDKYKLGVNINE